MCYELYERCAFGEMISVRDADDGTDGAYRDTGVSQIEELIESGDEECPEEAYCPGTDCVDGHVDVVRV